MSCVLSVNMQCTCRWDSNIACLELVKDKIFGILQRVPLLTPTASVGLAPRVAQLVSQMLAPSLDLRPPDDIVEVTSGKDVKVRCHKTQILPQQFGVLQ